MLSPSHFVISYLPRNSFPLDFLPDDVMAGQGLTLKVPPNTLKESDLECSVLGLEECQVPIQEGDELLTYVFQLSTKNGCEVRFKVSGRVALVLSAIASALRTMGYI